MLGQTGDQILHTFGEGPCQMGWGHSGGEMVHRACAKAQKAHLANQHSLLTNSEHPRSARLMVETTGKR